MTTHLILNAVLFLIGVGLLGGCYLYEEAQKRRKVQREAQRLQEAAIQQHIALRTRKQNTMRAMRRVARQRNTEQRG